MENYIKCFQTCTKCLISMTFLLALICLSTTTIHLMKNHPILSDFLLYYKRIFGLLALIFSILLVINACIGLYSLIYKSSKALKIYHIMSFLLSLITFCFSITVFSQCSLYRNIYNEKEMCIIDKDYSNLSKINLKAQDYLCSERCACNLMDFEGIDNKKLNISSQGACKIQDCPFTNEDFKKEIEVFKDLEALENNYNCGGICERTDFYIFTDINKKKPKFSCIYGIFRNLFLFYILTGSVFMVNSFILLMFSINSAFIQHNSEENTNYYDKLTN